MKRFIAICALSAFLVSGALADEIALKNGNKLTGTIVYGDKTKLKIKTTYGTLDIPRTDIQSACLGASDAAHADGAPATATTASGDMIASYLFDGNADDSSGNGLSGQLGGNLGFGPDRKGNPDGALVCRGNQADYCKINNDPKLLLKNFSLSAWVTGGSPKLWARIIDKYNFNERKGYALIYNHKEKAIALDAWSTDGNHLWIQTTSKLSKDWQHVCVTYDGKQLRIYYNGKMENQVEVVKTIRHNDRYLSIGNGYDGSNHFPWSGKIDEVKIFNRALSADEVKTLFGKDPSEGGLVDLKDKDSI